MRVTFCEPGRDLLWRACHHELPSTQHCEEEICYLSTHLMDFHCGSLSRIKSDIKPSLRNCSVDKILAVDIGGPALASPASTEKLTSVSSSGEEDMDGSLELTH